MNFKLMKNTTIVKTFDTLSEAKTCLNEHIKMYGGYGEIVVGFIKQSLDKYVIYYDVLKSPQFIDDTIDYISQWQYEHDEYIECVMIPYYDNILIIEINY